MTDTSERFEDAMETEIIESSMNFGVNFDYKAIWIKDIQNCADNLEIQLDKAKPKWKDIDNLLNKKRQDDSSALVKSRSTLTPVASSSFSPPSSSSSACSTLKTNLSTDDRDRVLELYDTLIKDEDNCWVLKATKRQAILKNMKPQSVEAKMRKFVATLTYVHPSMSFVLDTNDLNWVDYFSKEELEELKSSGQPVLRHIDDELKAKFEEIEKLNSALDAYNFGRLIDHHPIEQPLLAWLSQTLMQTAKFFIPGTRTPVQNMLESDKLYYLWSFLNTIYHNSNIEALGKEKTSISNANSLNAKRKLSATEEIVREKIGRRLDTIYIGSGVELGGLEAGPTRNNTKEFEDSMMKLPLVFKDMLSEIASRRPSLLYKAHVLGYNINGNSVRLIDADVPGGHIVRIRRTDELKYPSNNDDYILKIISLLEIASYGKTIIDDTYSLCCKTRVPPSFSSNSSILPPSFVPDNANRTQSSNSSGSGNKSRKKTK
ncbi:hypothetical protein INT45_012974 [Circinella minor]|uniref:Uncharacterized protein n=1 Tax=Circinella minor TaxID=1195481 RepID=A0A8H7RXC6_9FUNG|nr:hypothetical protein INT45_012974 [Circinella minor]